MKSLFNLIMIVFVCTCGSWAGGIVHDDKSISRYEFFEEDVIILPTNFAEPFIIDQEDLKLLGNKRIYHVDLVYTEYRESPDFNQQALNKRRVNELKRIFPQVISDKPSWSWIEQTGAKTRNVANTYFHGFVIYYADKLDHQTVGELLSPYAKSTTTFRVTCEEGGTFTYASGTKITIAPNSVTKADGTPIQGEFELSYREFRDPAEIAFSGLPMTYDNGKSKLNFSSVGMYEIRGSQNGEELKLKKPALIDFNCTKVVDDAAFYKMDDKTGEWKKIQEIEFGAEAEKGINSEATDAELIERVAETVDINVMPIVIGADWINSATLDDGKTEMKMGAGCWRKYEQLVKDSADFIKKAIDEEFSEQRKLHINEGYENQIAEYLINNWVAIEFVEGQSQRRGKRMVQDRSFTLLGQGSRDPGHSYPSVVRGLNSADFGVYNCDQVFRLGAVANILPIYKDASGNKISNGSVACLMDLNYNASFSFDPNYISCDPNGRNVVLLFTKDKKIYMLDEEKFKDIDLNSSQRTEFAMREVTDQIKSSDDLKNLLKI